MNHVFNPRCSGCVAAQRLQVTEPAHVDALHILIHNFQAMSDLAKLCVEIGFEINENVSAVAEACRVDQVAKLSTSNTTTH